MGSETNQYIMVKPSTAMYVNVTLPLHPLRTVLLSRIASTFGELVILSSTLCAIQGTTTGVINAGLLNDTSLRRWWRRCLFTAVGFAGCQFGNGLFIDSSFGCFGLFLGRNPFGL